MDLSPGSSDPEVRKVTRHRLQQTLDLVPLFNPLSVVCHAGYDAKRYGYNREKWVQVAMETWSWFAGELQALGSHLMLENVYEHHPREIRQCCWKTWTGKAWVSALTRVMPRCSAEHH